MVEPALARLAGMKFTPHLRTRALSIETDGVVIAPTYLPSSTKQTSKVPADTIVFVSLNRANRRIYEQLAAQGANVRVVGDASAARHRPTAMREGHQAGSAV